MAKKKTKRRSVFRRGGGRRTDTLSIGTTYADKVPVRRSK